MNLANAEMNSLPAILALEEAFPESQRWSEQSWQHELVADDHQVLLAHHDDQVVGVASFSASFDTAECLRVMVAPSHRNSGFGAWLMQGGLSWARHSGADRMLLEVNESNQAARGLYDSLSFRQIARRNNYYGTGQHALILERRLIRDGGDHD